MMEELLSPSPPSTLRRPGSASSRPRTEAGSPSCHTGLTWSCHRSDVAVRGRRAIAPTAHRVGGGYRTIPSSNCSSPPKHDETSAWAEQELAEAKLRAEAQQSPLAQRWRAEMLAAQQDMLGSRPRSAARAKQASRQIGRAEWNCLPYHKRLQLEERLKTLEAENSKLRREAEEARKANELAAAQAQQRMLQFCVDRYDKVCSCCFVYFRPISSSAIDKPSVRFVPYDFATAWFGMPQTRQFNL